MTSRGHDAAALDRRGVAWGLVAMWFDAALVGYLFGIVFVGILFHLGAGSRASA